MRQLIGGTVSNYVYSLLFRGRHLIEYTSIKTSEIALSLHVLSDLLDMIVSYQNRSDGVTEQREDCTKVAGNTPAVSYYYYTRYVALSIHLRSL